MNTTRPRILIFCCVLILLISLALPLAMPQRSEAATYGWTNTGGGVSASSIASLVTDGSVIYAGTTNSTVWQYNTATSAWSQLGGTIGSGNTIKSLAMYNSILYAGTSTQGVWRYSSSSWSNVSGSNLSSYSINALASGGSTLYAGTTSHGVYSSSNGTSWSQVSGLLGSLNDTVNAVALNGSALYAGTATRGVYTYGGVLTGWSSLGSGISSYGVNAIMWIGGSLYASLASHGVWRLSGSSWSNISSSTSLTGYTATSLASDNTNVFVGTTSHGVWRYTPGTSTWLDTAGSITTYTVQAVAVSGSIPYAGTAGQGVWKYDTVVVAPSITGISPASGPVGTSVTITGANFGTSGTVAFGSTASSITSWSDGSIVCVVPSVATGSVTVGVTTSAGTGTINFTVTAAAPTISSINPTSGNVGATVTITGNNFGATQGTSTVKFGTTAATVNSWSNTSIVCVVPSVATGSVTVGVTTSAGTGTINFTVTVAAPTISSISPTSGNVGATVTITGSNFGATQGTSTVKFASTTATVNSWSNTSIVCVVPSVATGSVTVGVTTSAGTGTINFTVTVPTPLPNITSISPTEGPAGTEVTLAGTGFGASQGSSILSIGGETVQAASWLDSQIKFVVPDVPAGTGDVIVSTNGGSDSIPFTVTQVTVPPVINSISPIEGPAGTEATLAGTGFGIAGVLIIAGNPTSTNSWSDTQIEFAIPSGLSAGAKEVVVAAAGGTTSTSFTVTESTGGPVISYMLPTEGQVGTIVSLVGIGFGAPGGTSTLTIGGVTPDVSSWSDALIRFTVPAGLSVGSKDVVVTVAGISATATFTVTPALPAPVINSLTPTSGPVRTSVAIDGSNFGTWQEGCSIYFGSTAITLPAWADTQITFIVPDGASGTVDVAVKTLSGTSNAKSFTVTETPPAPVISTISPVSAGVGAEVTITGSNFGASRGDSKVSLVWWIFPTDLAAGDYVTWSDSQIKFKVPAVSATSYSIVVTVGGQQSNSVAFDLVEVPTAPSIDSISPASGAAGTPVTTTGSGFGSSQGSSTLKFGSTDVTPASWSNTQITCNVPSMATGAVQVSVTTSLGSANIAFTITEVVLVPTITSLSPGQGSAGTTVTINGSNFGSTRGDSKVSLVWFIFGTDLTDADYTSWSATTITFKVPSTMGTGSYSVVVTVNGIQSNAVAFEVLAVVLPTPHINTLSPVTGNPGTEVTITGTDFGAAQGDSKVSFGSVAATAYTSWSDTEIKCKAPWQAAGVVQVGVTTAGGNSNDVAFTMTTPPPGELTITSITPNQGTTLDFSLSVDVQGTGFLEGATLKLDNGTSTIEATNVVVVSSTEITATFGLFFSAAGQYNVTVTNPDSSQATLTNGFTVASSCGTGSGTALLGFGLMMGLLSLSGTGFFRRRLRKNKNR